MEDNERAGYIATIVLLVLVFILFFVALFTHPHTATITEILPSRI